MNLHMQAYLWAFSYRGIEIGFSFLSFLLLAILLSPEDVGTASIILVIVNIAKVLSEFGTNNTIVVERLCEEKLSIIYFQQFFLTITIFISTLLLSQLLIYFKYLNIEFQLILFASFALILYGMESSLTTLWIKKLNFRHLAIRELFAGIISLTVALLLAYKGEGSLALIVQYSTAALIRTIYTLIFSEWLPSIKFFLSAPFTRISSFGYQFQVSWGILKYLDQLIVATILGLSSLGLYQFGKKIAELPIVNLSNIIGKYLFPKLSITLNEHKNEKEAEKIYLMNTKFIFWVTIPFCTLGIVWGPLIIEAFMPEPWQPIKQHIAYFFASAFFISSIPLFGSLLKASKAKKTLNFWGLSYPLVFLSSATFGAYFFSLFGLLVGTILTRFVFLIVSLKVTQNLLPDLGKKVAIIGIKMFLFTTAFIILILLISKGID